MTADSETRDALDLAVRAHAEDLIDPGEVIVSWIVVLATRRFDGGGAVINLVSDDGLPTYVARGMFGESLSLMDRNLAAPDDED